MKKIINILIFFVCISVLLTNMSFAIDTSVYGDIYNKPAGAAKVTNIGGKILGIVQTVGISIAVIMLVVIAIKYMIASVEEKAQLKAQLVPYVIGAVLLFSGSTIMTIIASWANGL